MTLARISGFRLVTQRLERLAAFYAALGFAIGEERVIEPDERTLLGSGGHATRRTMRIGSARVDLDCFAEAGAAYPRGSNAASLCFQHLALVTSDIAASWANAQAAGALPISRDGPVTLPPSAGSVTAVKFRDPEGHPLEFLQFPDMAAKGWTGTGVLGVDHSALSVANVAAAQAFYENAGLTRGDATFNQGPTQERLDGLDAVRVDVVPMMPAQPTPHVELLGYRSPVGVPCSAWLPTDVAATRIVWQGAAPALLRDPDGHLHQVEADRPRAALS